MENMVQEILTVSRMKSSKVGLKKETIQFSDILKQKYALFEDLIIQKDIDWNENITPDLSVIGDKALIQKVINNLISNAISYSPEGSSIYLTAFAEDGTVQFLLENTGIHIPDLEIPKLFDAFYRVEHSRNKKTGGSGLGLYIVKTILEQHQAEYSITNTERGVLFTIQFWKHEAAISTAHVFLTTHKKHIHHNSIPKRFGNIKASTERSCFRYEKK